MVKEFSLRVVEIKKSIFRVMIIILFFFLVCSLILNVIFIIKEKDEIHEKFNDFLIYFGILKPEEFIPPKIPNEIYSSNFLSMGFENNVRDVDDFRLWKRTLLNKVNELLKIDEFIPPEDIPSPVETVEFKEYVREKYKVKAYDGDEIIYYKLFPKEFEGPIPAVLIVPGSGEGVVGVIGEHNDYQKNIGVELVKNGYIVYAIENRGWGMRKINIGNLEWASSEQILDGYLLLFTDKTLAHYYTTDTLQVLNYMKNDDDIEYIAVGGCSLGGTISYWVAALDEDIDAVIIASGLLKRSELNISASLSQFNVPGYIQYFDDPDVVATIGPRPIYISYGSLDNPVYRYEGSKKLSYTYVKRAYELLDSESNITFKFHNSKTDPTIRLRNPGHTYDIPSLLEFLDKSIGG